MTIICIKADFRGRLAEARRDLPDRFETDIVVYGQPGLAIYPKKYWRLVNNRQEDDR